MLPGQAGSVGVRGSSPLSSTLDLPKRQFQDHLSARPVRVSVCRAAGRSTSVATLRAMRPRCTAICNARDRMRWARKTVVGKAFGEQGAVELLEVFGLQPVQAVPADTGRQVKPDGGAVLSRDRRRSRWAAMLVSQWSSHSLTVAVCPRWRSARRRVAFQVADLGDRPGAGRRGHVALVRPSSWPQAEP